MNRNAFILRVISLFLIVSISALAADNCVPDPKAPKIEQGKDGTYTFGKWTYKFTITAKDSRSEGYHGELSVDGKPAELPKQPTEGVCTPWGTMYWVGNPVLLWGAHGWMLKAKPSGSGAFVSLPDLNSKLVVTAMVLGGERGEPIKEEWIKKELQKMGALGQIGVTEEWFSLVPGKVHVLHDSRHYGHAEMVLEDKGGDNKPFAVNVEGTVVELPRKLGEHRLVKHTLSSSVASMDLYLAFSVEEVAAVSAE